MRSPGSHWALQGFCSSSEVGGLVSEHWILENTLAFWLEVGCQASTEFRALPCFSIRSRVRCSNRVKGSTVQTGLRWVLLALYWLEGWQPMGNLLVIGLFWKSHHLPTCLGQLGSRMESWHWGRSSWSRILGRRRLHSPSRSWGSRWQFLWRIDLSLEFLI